METAGTWLPVKKPVSSSSPRITAGSPNSTTLQSCPATRLRLLSQPSIVLPQSVKAAGSNSGGLSTSMRSAALNQSSVANSTREPTPALATSLSSAQ